MRSETRSARVDLTVELNSFKFTAGRVPLRRTLTDELGTVENIRTSKTEPHDRSDVGVPGTLSTWPAGHCEKLEQTRLFVGEGGDFSY